MLSHQEKSIIYIFNNVLKYLLVYAYAFVEKQCK